MTKKDNDSKTNQGGQDQERLRVYGQCQEAHDQEGQGDHDQEGLGNSDKKAKEPTTKKSTTRRPMSTRMWNP